VTLVAVKQEQGLDVLGCIFNVWLQDLTYLRSHNCFIHPCTMLTGIEVVLWVCRDFPGFDACTRFSFEDNERLEHLARCRYRHSNRCSQCLRR
jgi:hypothetical protein